MTNEIKQMFVESKEERETPEYTTVNELVKYSKRKMAKREKRINWRIKQDSKRMERIYNRAL